MEKLKEASVEDGKNPGGRKVQRILRELIGSIKREEVEVLILRQLLKHKQWSNRIQQIAREEFNMAKKGEKVFSIIHKQAK